MPEQVAVADAELIRIVDLLQLYDGAHGQRYRLEDVRIPYEPITTNGRTFYFWGEQVLERGMKPERALAMIVLEDNRELADRVRRLDREGSTFDFEGTFALVSPDSGRKSPYYFLVESVQGH